MLFLILSILCSVSVGVLFKIARKYNTSNTQIVAYNYIFALSLCYLSFSPDITAITVAAPWNLYIVIGILLPSIFLGYIFIKEYKLDGAIFSTTISFLMSSGVMLIYFYRLNRKYSKVT